MSKRRINRTKSEALEFFRGLDYYDQQLMALLAFALVSIKERDEAHSAWLSAVAVEQPQALDRVAKAVAERMESAS